MGRIPGSVSGWFEFIELFRLLFGSLLSWLLVLVASFLFKLGGLPRLLTPGGALQGPELTPIR
ncbi:MAG: hypothetical protein ACUVXB_16490 [Bryobacteraceae bacterium]